LIYSAYFIKLVLNNGTSKLPVGEYALWTLHPSGGYGGCDGLSGFGIPIIITD